MKMQYFTRLVCAALCIVVVSAYSDELERRKRFVLASGPPSARQSSFNIGDFAKELSDALSTHINRAVHNIAPQTARAVQLLIPQASNRKHEAHPETKKGVIRVPIGRETEGDEKEVEVFDPVEVKQPGKPVIQPGIFSGFVPLSIPFGIFTPWWNGPNICVERNQIDEPQLEDSQGMTGFNINIESTSCLPTHSSYTCTKKIQTNGVKKTIIVKRQCCHGFIRRTDGRPGCSELKMDSLLDTMKNLEMTKFLSWIESAGLKEKLQTENFTVFAPSNEAIIDYEDETEDNEISAIAPARLTDVSLKASGHLVDGFVNLDSVECESILKTIGDKSTIRINKYHSAHEIVTANCVPITGKNNFATNGIVHLTSGVLPQPTQTIGEILESEAQFSIFNKLLNSSDIMEDLKKSSKPWTVFVPNDAAFRKLPTALRKQIEEGESCVQSILNQHVVEGTVCTSAVVGQLKVRNILKNILKLTKDESEKLRVNGVEIEKNDYLGTNGVIQVIDEVMIPPQARTLIKALAEDERQDILDLIEKAGLVSTFEEMQNVTFFLPSVESIKNLSNTTLQEMEDSEMLKTILMYHLVQPNIPTSKFVNNLKVTTVNGDHLRLKLHEFLPGMITGASAQCAVILDYDRQVCGGVVHKINKLLLPPKGNIIETLKNMEDHDIVKRLLNGTDLEKKLEEAEPFTFLAPTDKAFEKLDAKYMQELLDNKSKAEELLKLHILPESLCCGDVSGSSPFNRQFVRSYDGATLPLHRGLQNKIGFGAARVIECDIPATNGLIHSVNSVIFPQKPVTNFFGFDLWPLFK